MIEFVRVRDKETGHHYSVPRARFEVKRELWQELKQPATDGGGAPLPPKFRRKKGAQKSGTAAAESGESS